MQIEMIVSPVSNISKIVYHHCNTTHYIETSTLFIGQGIHHITQSTHFGHQTEIDWLSFITQKTILLYSSGPQGIIFVVEGPATPCATPNPVKENLMTHMTLPPLAILFFIPLKQYFAECPCPQRQARSWSSIQSAGPQQQQSPQSHQQE
jgi:hypothetical protein